MGINQAHFEKVTKLVISKLQGYYRQELTEEMIDALIIDLGEYDALHLEEAMVQLRRKSNKAPSIHAIMTECEALRKRDKAAGIIVSERKEIPSHVEKEIKSRNMVKAYMDGWRAHPLAGQAENEGWDLGLFNYLRCAAHAQADMICGRRVFLSAEQLFPHLDQARDAQVIQDFHDGLRTNAVKGEINVQVPEGVVQHYRQRAAAGEQLLISHILMDYEEARARRLRQPPEEAKLFGKHVSEALPAPDARYFKDDRYLPKPAPAPAVIPAGDGLDFLDEI